MKKTMSFIVISLLFIVVGLHASQEGKNVAKVLLVRGNVESKSIDGNLLPVKQGDWIKEGMIIKTADKSLARLTFIDKSSVNIGPNSEMKIEKFSKDEPGVLNVLGGKIRAQVSKNYLDMEKDKSKMFVKSKSAVMGIRGTDFLFSTNPQTNSSTAILFEGSVVFNRLEAAGGGKSLEDIVNKGRKIDPGQFSIVQTKGKPTVPAKMSSNQFKALMVNAEFGSASDKSSSDKKAKAKKMIPPGISEKVARSDGDSLQKVLSDSGSGMKVETVKIDMKETMGYVKGDDIKPMDGAIVHVDSGTIIPLGSDSKFDQDKGEWVSASIGSIDSAGSYIPPTGFVMTDQGNLLKETKDGFQEVKLSMGSIDDIKSLDKMETQSWNGDLPDMNQRAPASIDEFGGPKLDDAGLLDDPIPAGGIVMRPCPPGEVNCGPPTVNYDKIQQEGAGARLPSSAVKFNFGKQ